MKQSLLLIIIFLAYCTSPSTDKRKVDVDNVESVDIRKGSDTAALRLTTDQAIDFINKWNSSKPKGAYKFFSKYILTIHFKGDSSTSYSTSSELIKQNSDFSYSIGDTSYFQNIWLDRVGLTNDYIEYLPVYFRNDEFTVDHNRISENHRKGIKQVLTYYKHTFTDIRGQIFYKGVIDKELLLNYTTKANDTSWLLLHQ